MKKMYFTIVLVVSTMFTQATTYSYLMFTSANNVTTSFGVTNLTLTINGTNLQVTNDEGTVNLVLSELASMEFSTQDSLTSIENILDADSPIQVFSISGISVGVFSSLLDAAKSLTTGMYVISNGRVTQTIEIK